MSCFPMALWACWPPMCRQAQHKALGSRCCSGLWHQVWLQIAIKACRRRKIGLHLQQHRGRSGACWLSLVTKRPIEQMSSADVCIPLLKARATSLPLKC